MNGQTATRVRVHFNLHMHLWSITLKGKVIDHQSTYSLGNVRAIVSEKSRQRVLVRRCRAVHAWLEGEPMTATEELPVGAVEVHYNPFRAATFTLRDGTPVTAATRAYFIGKRAFITQ